MRILDLRILPPIAIGRLGSSETPLEAFDLTVDKTKPLDFRQIVPKESLKVDPDTGKLEKYTPGKIIFKDATGLNDKEGTVRPVAPFLEVFAITDQQPDRLVPLTTELLTEAGLSVADVSWNVDIANIKLFRRTESEKDKIRATIKNINTHKRIPLQGECENFRPGRTLPLGYVQFIQPTAEFPEIRFRFTPAEGKVYGASKDRILANGQKPTRDPLYTKFGDEFLLYSETGEWSKYEEGNQEHPVLTNPGFIFAGYNKTTTRASWGYVDDECDGFVSVQLKNSDGNTLAARAHICAGPPAYAPDTLPVRVISDEIEQILLGPDVDREVPIEEAQEIVRRALETVRLLNTAIMNGNPYYGNTRTASTMVAQDSNDFGRMYEPIMAPSLVDNLAVREIHERIFNGLGTGASPWFENAIRRPDKIGDLSNEERRKMPAMMRGADGRALCLTYRQINTIIKSAANAMFRKFEQNIKPPASTFLSVNDLMAQLHYQAAGNPFSVLPRTAISNCFPGLELDFRNLWRRAFKNITLIENNNLVIKAEGALEYLTYHRLVGIDGEPTMVVTTGPTFPRSGDGTLINTGNPNGVSFMEWSNNLAKVLQKRGEEIVCYFTKLESNTEVVVEKKDLNDGNPDLIKVMLTVNDFFENNSAVFAEGLLEPGELTQGLCAPWQNDYRECACYYWAASRPDYVNVVPDEKGLSKGDNWMSKKRTGQYIPDGRTDGRLFDYDDLFKNWQGELNFIVKGFDALDSEGNKTKS
jgi:hypothetical protein